jgi:adenylosuccinate synthase
MKNNISATIIIGANYGDEGKGLITDFMAKKYKNSLVVRHNGGSQAAHTVQVNGKRHVFHHFGSGTLAGRPTYLSSHFLCDPIRFHEEYNLLNKNFNISPEIFVDINAEIVTPWDCILNQISANGDTCGAGINETLTRIENRPDLRLAVNMPFCDAWIIIRKIAIDYFPKEITKRIQHGAEEICITATSCQFIDHFFEDYKDFSNKLKLTDSLSSAIKRIKDVDHIIFEGSQGLMLDQNHKNFPFVTRSNTGVKNAMEICAECGITDIEVVYVTRSYMTRHGAGPFPHETSLDQMTEFNIVDQTNIPNQYQGSLRFAYFQPFRMCKEILKDIEPYTDNSELKVSLAITCMDQLKHNILNVPCVLKEYDEPELYHDPDYDENEIIYMNTSELIKVIYDITDNLFDRILMGRGPEAKDVFPFEEELLKELGKIK